MPIRSVAILLHEHDVHAERTNYRVWALAANWRQQGIRVDVLRGVARETDADVLLPHLDLSYVPNAYWAFMRRHPNVVNGKLRDIRKTRISSLRVGLDDAYAGPVIVKTAANCNGFHDVWMERRQVSLATRVRTRIERMAWVQKRSLGWTRTLSRYPVFRSVRDVPRGAFANRNLIVERFMPERRGDRYVIRQWIMCGSRSIGRELTSTEPIIKSYNSEWTILPPEPPPEIVAPRRELGVDYGKMDYVMHEGKGVLLDVNPTPTLRDSISVRDPKTIAGAAEMAAGIEQFDVKSGADGGPYELPAAGGARRIGLPGVHTRA